MTTPKKPISHPVKLTTSLPPVLTSLEGGRKQARGGKREDLDNRYFRSRWEANYARYLNWLVWIGEIEKWEYEPDTFEFEAIKRGSRFYTPDFKIWNKKPRTIEYHEIKGYMDQKSATKLKRMAKYFPDVKVILIDKEAYYALSDTMKRAIPGWESDKKRTG